VGDLEIALDILKGGKFYTYVGERRKNRLFFMSSKPI